jgi:DNA-binding response OmpR family regulator
MATSILVIEDDPHILEIIRKSLIERNCNLLVATSGEAALRIAATTVPDLILAYIGLPGLNGYETISRAKAIPGFDQIPVIFLSGRSREEDNGRSFACGGQLYLRKPFSIYELRSLVDLALGSILTRQ